MVNASLHENRLDKNVDEVQILLIPNNNISL